MKTRVNPLKPLIALSMLGLLAVAPLQQAQALGEPNVRTAEPSDGGTLRGTPDEEQPPAEDAAQAQDEAGVEPADEAPEAAAEAEPEEASEDAADADAEEDE
jgi:hypothetical protein